VNPELNFTIGQGDTSPALDFLLSPSTIILTGATAVFRRRPAGSTTWTQSDPAVIAVATVSPTLRYVWAAGDTDTAGIFEAQFVVTYTDSTVETFPNAEVITVNIVGEADPLSQQVMQVRFLVGDSRLPYQISNSEILFALGETTNIYSAAALCARALAARYARDVDYRFETIESKNGQRSKAFDMLARQLDQRAKRAGGLGEPVAGGISRTDVESVHADTDRVRPFFRENLFNNPPPPNE
jgi:hypothetical protein